MYGCVYSLTTNYCTWFISLISTRFMYNSARSGTTPENMFHMGQFHYWTQDAIILFIWHINRNISGPK